MISKKGKCLTLGIVAASLAFGADLNANLNPQTAKAWESYVASAHAQMQARLGATACFLWSEEKPERLRRLRGGEILVAPADSQTPRRIPGGLIHHWLGAVFIPDVTLPQVLAAMRSYSRYPEYYPSIASSTLVATDGSTDRVTSIEKHQAMFSRIALDADMSTVFVNAGEKRIYSESSSTRLQQIQDYGGKGQHELQPGSPKAYLWALSTITRYQERDGGVYLELEGMALSRDIPSSLRWMVDPFVRRASVAAMATSLKETRDALTEDRGHPAEALPSGAITFRAR